MIDPKAIVSYSQYKEDIILSTLLYDVDKGFYIDVGANYDTIDSVTKHFYERGWTGINIEPIEELYNSLVKNRPKDINMNCGLGDKKGLANFREYVGLSGHSTFDSGQKSEHGKIEFKDYEVEIKTLIDVFEENKIKEVDFIKIDVEGFEYSVINGGDWKKYRPKVICIEANHTKKSKNWRVILEKSDYKQFIFDGLNEYYVRSESWSITEEFPTRIVDTDYHSLRQHQWQSWEQDSKDLERLTELVETLTNGNKVATDEVINLKGQLKENTRLSMKDRKMIDRIKISLYGVSVDWYRHVKQSKHR